MRDNHTVTSEPRAASDSLTVGRAAALVGVSVKTLHHWDGIGLVRPSERTRAGYRVYSGEDIARVHRVLVYRELGFPLAEIGRLLDDPRVDAHEHLRRQRAELEERIARLRTMVGAVDRMMAASRTGLRLTPQEQVEIFGDDWQPARVEEARERWGDTEQWAQYAERAAERTPQDWQDYTATAEALNADLAAALRAGTAPAPPRPTPSPSATAPCSHSTSTARTRCTSASAARTSTTPGTPTTSTGSSRASPPG